MKKLLVILFACCLLAGCASKPYAAPGASTGSAELDAQLDEILQSVCRSDAPEKDNLLAVYRWVMQSVTYRASEDPAPESYSDDVIASLARKTVEKRRGDCASEAALMTAFLRRMGYPAKVVVGSFIREAGQEPTDHAWASAEISGKTYYFDPLYGRYFAGQSSDAFCMADAEQLKDTHLFSE